MSSKFVPTQGLLSQFEFLHVEQNGGVVHLQLRRTEKRNAINDQLIAEIHTAFVNLPPTAQVVVISGKGEHFCAGLDLSDIVERDVSEGIAHSRAWHAAFEQIQFGRVPVVVAMQGATVGGGMELASSAHIRVADRTAFYALPEGQRGIFVGGGGSARIPRLIGVSAMTDMMLTGRVLDAEEGHDLRFSNYLVAAGTALDYAFVLAEKIASNAPLSNFAVVQALPRIAEMNQRDGLFTEALMSSIAQSDNEAKERVRQFLDKKTKRLAPAER